MDFEETRLLARLTAIESERVRLSIEIEELEPVEASYQQSIESVIAAAAEDLDGDYSDEHDREQRKLRGVQAELAARRSRIEALDRQVELARQEFGPEQGAERPALDSL
jgi:hypothetical protein